VGVTSVEFLKTDILQGQIDSLIRLWSII